MPEQRSEGWYEARRGMITASEFHQIMHASPAALERLARKKLGERKGATIPNFDAPQLRWGKDHEDQGLAMVSMHPEVMKLGYPLQRVELQIHPEYFYIGASPDAFVGLNHGVELKCPYKQAVHRKTLRYGMPLRHMAQVQGGMWVTGRDYWFFASFDAHDIDAEDSLYLILVERDEAYIENMATHIFNFWEMIESGQFDQRCDPLTDPIPQFF